MSSNEELLLVAIQEDRFEDNITKSFITACKEECWNLAEWLLYQGADISAQNNYCIRNACSDASFDTIRKFVDAFVLKGIKMEQFEIDECFYNCMARSTYGGQREGHEIIFFLSSKGIDFCNNKYLADCCFFREFKMVYWLVKNKCDESFLTDEARNYVCLQRYNSVVLKWCLYTRKVRRQKIIEEVSRWIIKDLTKIVYSYSK
jgi:hypothetical protein